MLASPTMKRLALIALLYYTAIWGVIANLLVYATTTFQFTSQESGLLLSFFGLLNAIIQVRSNVYILAGLAGLAGLIQWIFWAIQWIFVHCP